MSQVCQEIFLERKPGMKNHILNITRSYSPAGKWHLCNDFSVMKDIADKNAMLSQLHGPTSICFLR